MKSAVLTAFLALGACLVAGSASAQAAGRLPNTFDDPQTQTPTPRTPAPAPSQASPAPAPTPPTAEQIETARKAEAMLRKTVAAMQAGEPNYGDMSEDLAPKVREQSAAIGPLIQGFGALEDVTYIGHENGAEMFAVTFARQATQWIIAQDEAGKIVVLLFRPAPAA